MKTTILTTILLSSLTLFNGCSEVTPEPEKKLDKEKLSISNIIGIQEATQKTPLFIAQEDTNPKYNYFIIDGNEKYNHDNINSSGISNDIEVVSYASYKPKTYQDTEALINNIEANARSFLGTRYVWGATGPTKFDCSGFTQWIYRDAGIKIPRVSRDQAKVGYYVTYNNLRRGDMVFFDTKKHKRGVVTHVGIYLGNGNFIHASSVAKKVVVYNFNKKPYYKKRFLWGRRVIHDNPYYASNY